VGQACHWAAVSSSGGVPLGGPDWCMEEDRRGSTPGRGSEMCNQLRLETQDQARTWLIVGSCRTHVYFRKKTGACLDICAYLDTLHWPCVLPEEDRRGPTLAFHSHLGRFWFLLRGVMRRLRGASVLIQAARTVSCWPGWVQVPASHAPAASALPIPSPLALHSTRPVLSQQPRP
jgi:hypothetical protein